MKTKKTNRTYKEMLEEFEELQKESNEALYKISFEHKERTRPLYDISDLEDRIKLQGSYL